MAYKEKIADAYVDVKANTSQYESSMSGIKSSLGNLAKIAAGAFATKKLIEFGWSAMDVASEFEEVGSKFDVVFKGMQAEADKVAASFAKDFDLASGSAEKLLSGTGDLLTGFGFTKEAALDLSQRTNELAADLASFNNIQGGAQEASKRLNAALTGETEGLKALGVVVKQGSSEFKDRVKELQQTKNLTEQQAKSEAILEQAFKQSKNAIGDYARTSDSFANKKRAASEQWEEFNAVIGKGIQELLSMGSVIGSISGKLKSMSAAIKRFSEGGGFKLMAINIKSTFKKIGEYIKLPFSMISAYIAQWVVNVIERFKFLGKSIKNAMELDFDAIKRDYAQLKTVVTDPMLKAAEEYEGFKVTMARIDEERMESTKKVNEAIAKSTKDAAEDAADSVIASEDKKQDAVKKTTKLRRGDVEDIRKIMQDLATKQKNISGGVPGLGGDNSQQNIPSAIPGMGISSLGTMSAITQVAQAVIESNKILSDIRDSSTVSPAIA